MGRTGHWLAIQKFGIEPDLVCIAKGLGSGIPIGACLTKGRTNDILLVGEHGSTFGGGAFACAVALAVLETIERDGLLENASVQGCRLAEGLASLPGVIEVRGDGLMRGAVLDAPVARDVVRTCLQNRLIINATDEVTLRLVPPLIVTSDEVDSALAILRSALG
jgi:acetylornithine aminotransferase